MNHTTENLVRERGPVRVAWVCLGEGYNGEYDAKNPEDELLLRFDVAVKDEDIGDFVTTESRCTCFAANAPTKDKEAALDVLLDHFHNAYTSQPRHGMVDKQNFKFSDIIGKCIRPGREPLDYHMWEYNNKPEWYTPISLTDKARIADTVMDYAEMYVGQSMTGQGMSM